MYPCFSGEFVTNCKFWIVRISGIVEGHRKKLFIAAVGCTGIEPVTSCLSSMRSEPTELTPLIPFGETKVIIHGNLGKGFGWGLVGLWLRVSDY